MTAKKTLKALSLSGKKTYILGAFLLAYLVTTDYLTGEPPNEDVVMGLLAGMGITIRMGVQKSRKR